MGCGPAGGPPAFDPWGYAPPVYQPPPRPTVTLPRPDVAPAVRPVAVPPPAALGVTLDVPPAVVPPPAELGVGLEK